ncbi:MAG TPA: hypothetical protein VNO22_06410 [Planctomycetota bacterium]|nr:hypothetical protein [Planctomycetota bacterium]
MRTTGPGQPDQLLLDVLDALRRIRVPAAVAGGFAVSYHGLPRATRDADAVVWPRGAGMDPDQLSQHLRTGGFDVVLRHGDPGDPIGASLQIRDPHGNSVDLLIGVRGMDPEAPSRTVEAPFFDDRVRLLGAEDLIAMKLFAAGPVDIEDVRSILHVSGPTLDLPLLRRLARRYGPEEEKALDALLREAGLQAP